MKGNSDKKAIGKAVITYLGKQVGRGFVSPAPLTSSASPKITFKWSEECQCAFESTKALLCGAPILAAPHFSRPFELDVDASASGAGAVLLQEDDRGIDHPVGYFSKKFKKTPVALQHD